MSDYRDKISDQGSVYVKIFYFFWPQGPAQTEVFLYGSRPFSLYMSIQPKPDWHILIQSIKNIKDVTNRWKNTYSVLVNEYIYIVLPLASTTLWSPILTASISEHGLKIENKFD